MKKLTLEYAKGHDFNFLGCIRYFNPDWTDAECEFYLWEKTPFPFVDAETLINQMNKDFLSDKSK